MTDRTSSTSALNGEARPKRILVVDGESLPTAGVMSALYILREMMRRAGFHTTSQVDTATSPETSESSSDEAFPCDCFDLIVGSGHGGWVAILLARFRMSVSQVIRVYRDIHSPNYRGCSGLSKEERAANFVDHIKQLVRSHSHVDDTEEKFRVELRCHAAVLAMTSQHVSAPTVFRTYRARKHRIDDCSIWEVVRACTADVNLFPPARIGDQTYISATQAGHCNPIDTARSEVEVAFPGSKVRIIVSLGSGHPGIISIPDVDSYAEAAIRIAQDAENKSQEAARKLAPDEKKRYFRFNVQHGLEHYTQDTGISYGQVETHTLQYCQRSEVDEPIDHAIRLISGYVSPQ